MAKTIAARYRRAGKAGKAKILDELCATTGWHRCHARKAQAGRPKPVRPRQPRARRYGPDVVAALQLVWAVLGAPTGKRLAPVLAGLVARLRRFGELVVSYEVAALLVGMSPATIDRRPGPARAAMTLRGRGHTKPGSLLRDAIGIRTLADWDDAVPGFARIDLVGHEGGYAVGEHAVALAVTDIATGPAENRSVPNKARKWVIAALQEICLIRPLPILGVDAEGGSEFIGFHLLCWCEQRKITFTRSRPGNSNDGAHVEQKNWDVVRTVAGDHRNDTETELLLPGKIWVLQSLVTNYFRPQQKLVSKVRDEAEITKKYDAPTTPHRRAERHTKVTAADQAILADTHAELNPAAIGRQIQARTAELLTLTTSKAAFAARPQAPARAARAS
ncbi:MAG: integrase [Mycobacteriales bacterium]